jgi:hypothetical protein
LTTNTPVQRQRRDKKGPLQAGCGLLLVGGFTMLLLCVGLYAFGVFTPLLLQVMGVQRVADTDAVFADYTTEPTVEIVNAQSQNSAVVELGTYGAENLNVGTRNYEIRSGTTRDGAEIAVIRFDESAIKELCDERSTICRQGTDRFRNVAFDLRPGGAVVNVDVNAGILWQRVGVVMRLDDQALAFDVVGIDINGTTFNPDTLPGIVSADARESVQNAIADIERIGNEILTSLIVSTGGGTYELVDVSIDDQYLTLTMR